ncbi:toluene tolerance protein [Zavarzinia aquatilis]|uniref:Toluene tolerance protein n=2 Tax=Zavarzinia aquatilis TaxID=2211142 RepID=A0A317EAY3_9PROT|nr:toluene tolerance protein [Zavarzinia aquatilis]
MERQDMTTRRQFIVRLGAFGIALAGLASTGRGARAGDAATAFIDTLGGQAISTLADKSVTDAERESRFRALFLSAFDVETIGQFVLGRYRRSATPEQIAEFNRLYAEDVVRTYSRRLSQYAGEKLVTLGSQQQDGEIVVRSQIQSPSGQKPVAVDWRLSETSGSYKIVDVVIENLSMRSAQREDFASVMSAGGVDALLAGLRKKNPAS